MTTEVIHLKTEDDGQVRVTLAEPHGLNQASRRVIARTSAAYDHAGTRVAVIHGKPVEIPYAPGDPVDGVELYLAGQREFRVPAATTQLEFDDGTVFPIGGAR